MTSTATLTFGGTATTLLRLGPFTLLTDPNFLHRGQRAYLGYGLWSRRRTEPAVLPRDLPPLDAILLSHLHGDHFDRIARRELDRSLPVLTTEHGARRLRRWGFSSADGLAPWTERTLTRDDERLTVTSIPGTHGPGPIGKLLPPVMGSVLEITGPAGTRRIFVTGDVLFRRELAQVRERLGHLDTMVVHLGGTRILGVTVTMDARQGVELMRLLCPDVTVPIHYDDYGVFKSSLSDFLDEVGRRLPNTDVRLADRGETVSLEPAQIS